MKGGDCSKLVSCKFYLAKMAWVGEKDKKKGLKRAATGIGFAAPFVCFLFFSDVSLFFIIFAYPLCMHWDLYL
jgi:hypothetical protein